jgi:Asp-tRNA(Asn)/Glu-tRNA(Gln) amidotransferase B subunit
MQKISANKNHGQQQMEKIIFNRRKVAALDSLKGRVMKLCKSKANPALAAEIPGKKLK